jgi:hypothetical protein
LEGKEDNGTQGRIELSLVKNGITGILGLNTISTDDIDALQYDFTQEDDTMILKNLHKSQIASEGQLLYPLE